MRRFLNFDTAACVALVLLAYFWLALQPPDKDDFSLFKNTSEQGALPVARDLYTHWGGRAAAWFWVAIFACNPFSWVKPSIFLSTVILASSSWMLLRQEHTLLKVVITSLLILGFPYSGNVLPWNSSAAVYGISSGFMLGFLSLLACPPQSPKPVHCIIFSVLLFGSALGCEVWMAAHGGIVLLCILLHFFGRSVLSPSMLITYCAVLALCCLIYINGGNAQRLAAEGHAPALNAATLTDGFVRALRELITVVRNTLPVLLVLFFVRDEKPSRPLLHLRLSLLGGMVFIFIFMVLLEAARFPFHWRARFAVALYLSALIYFSGAAALALGHLKPALHLPVRICALLLGLALLSHSAYQMYAVPKFDLMKWLSVRDAARNGTYSGTPANWGTQDDRHRILYQPDQPDLQYAADKIKTY